MWRILLFSAAGSQSVSVGTGDPSSGQGIVYAVVFLMGIGGLAAAVWVWASVMDAVTNYKESLEREEAK